MAKKKSEPSPPDDLELIEQNEDQLASPSPENMDDDSNLQDNTESSPDFVDMPTGAETTGEAETISEEFPHPVETSAFPDASQIDTGVIAPVIEDDAVLRSPILTHRRERILTIDAKDEIQTEEEREATIWHEIQNAYRTRRILTGTLDGIEKMDSGLTLAVVNYKGFRVVILQSYFSR